MEAAADYSFNRSPRRLLRADRLPHRLAAGQLPGRVHGGADLDGDVDQGQGPVLRQPLRRDGDQGAAAGRQRVRPRLRRLGQEHPLRARRGQERRPRRRSQAILDARSADGEFGSLYDFCERVDTRAVNKRAVECLVKCGALDSHRRHPQGNARGAADGDGRRPEGAGGLAPGPGLDLRPRRRRATTAPAPAASSTRRSASTSTTSASCCGWRRRRSARSSPRTRWPRSATRCGPAWTAASRSWRASRTARSSPSAASSPSSSATRRSAATPMAFATLDDVEGQVETLVLGKSYTRVGRVARRRQHRPGQGPARPPGARPDQARRPGGRALRADRGRGRPARRQARAPQPIVLRIDAGEFGPSLVDELKAVFEHFPGEAEVMLEMETPRGDTPAPLRRRATACGPRPPCAPSSTPCSARAPGPPEPRLPHGGLGTRGARTRRWTPSARRHRLTFVPRRAATARPGPPASAASAGRSATSSIEPAGCIEMGCRYLYSYEDISDRQPLHRLRQQGLQRRDRPRPVPARRATAAATAASR